jgi:hypothetical protein
MRYANKREEIVFEHATLDMLPLLVGVAMSIGNLA